MSRAARFLLQWHGPPPITADASDSDGFITQVEFFINGTSIGVDPVEPYSLVWSIPANGFYEIKAIATDNENNTKTVISNIVVNAGVVCSQINNSTDDAEEKASGVMKLTSSDLELVNDAGINQTVGLRFVNLNIPNQVTITDASIQFVTNNTTNLNPCILNVFGQASDNATTFTNNLNDISNRLKTNASVTWSPADWLIAGEDGSNQQTIDISPVIQEIVNRNGFTTNSSVGIIIEGVGLRNAESYDGLAIAAPKLCVTYVGCPDSDSDGTCDVDDLCPGGPEPGTACDDGDPLTYDDTIAPNCNCIGIPYDCPAIPANFSDPCDDGDPNTTNEMIDLNCDCLDFITATDTISSSNDDAEESATGVVDLASTDLELIFDNSDQIVGLRFANINIPMALIR